MLFASHFWDNVVVWTFCWGYKEYQTFLFKHHSKTSRNNQVRTFGNEHVITYILFVSQSYSLTQVVYHICKWTVEQTRRQDPSQLENKIHLFLDQLTHNNLEGKTSTQITHLSLTTLNEMFNRCMQLFFQLHWPVLCLQVRGLYNEHVTQPSTPSYGSTRFSLFPAYIT